MNKQSASLVVTLLILSQIAFCTSAAAENNKVPGKTEAVYSPADKDIELITGAFGIPLGDKFDTSMVAKVLSKQEHIYDGQAGAKLKGSLIRVEPSKPDERFQSYTIKTTYDGLIYAIQGDYQYKVEPEETRPQGKGKGMGKPGNKKPATAVQKTCKATVKTMAGGLESRYGKARGQGWDGLWFAFRQRSEGSNKGLKLYGHRCRTGLYSIVYSDEIARRGAPSAKAGAPSGTDTPASQLK